MKKRLQNLEEELVYHNPSTDKLEETIQVTELTQKDNLELTQSIE